MSPPTPAPLALLYRNALPKPHTSYSAQALCEHNGWQKRGEWGAIRTAHFHLNTHECYAIIQSSSRLVLGRSKPEDSEEGTGGVEVDVSAGDVVVVPAGVSHMSLRSGGGYRYIGVYPKECPKWRSNHCKGGESMEELEREIRRVAMPGMDPVYGG